MNTSSGSGGFTDFEDQPAESHEAIAHGHDVSERWRLAGRDDLSRPVLELLSEDSDENVRMSLAMNFSVPTDILNDLAQRYPELISIISTNANAKPSFKKNVSILEQTDLSLAQFLDDEEATAEERKSFTKETRRLHRQQLNLHRAGKDPESVTGPLLGEVWDKIRRS